MEQFFSQYFDVDPDLLEEYGALDMNLVSDAAYVGTLTSLSFDLVRNYSRIAGASDGIA